ncbi:MAG: hypothetical protein WKG07_29855 [Hymenobacter sp.]
MAGAQLLSRVPPQAPAAAGAVAVIAPPPTPTTPRATYGRAYAQNQFIGAVAMHEAGYRGEGMQIAVFDAGFPGADRLAALQTDAGAGPGGGHPQLRGRRPERVPA